MKAASELELFRLLADLDVLLPCTSLEGSLDASVELVSAPKPSVEPSREAKSEAGQWLADLQEFDAYHTDPYQLFGIPYDATDATIKSTFRKLSLKVHPDRCPGLFWAADGCSLPAYFTFTEGSHKPCRRCSCCDEDCLFQSVRTVQHHYP